jgi:hypothetical protein
VGKIKDYYKTEDDKLIFMKKLPVGMPTATVSEVESPPTVVRVEAPDPVLSAS